MKKDREVQFKLRLPESLLAAVSESAESSGRSIGAEINANLEFAYADIANIVIQNRHAELAVIDRLLAGVRTHIEWLEAGLQDTEDTPEHRAEAERLIAVSRQEIAKLSGVRNELQQQLEWASDGKSI